VYYSVHIESPQGLFIYQTMSPFTYLRHVREEFAHIVWPSTNRAIAHTIVVIVIATVIAILVAILDYALGGIVSRALGL
jgi:preprotein translocase SecE subunit